LTASVGIKKVRESSMQSCPYCEKTISVQLGQGSSKNWAILECQHCHESIVLLDPISNPGEPALVQKAVRTLDAIHQHRQQHQQLGAVALEIRAMTEESEMEFAKESKVSPRKATQAIVTEAKKVLHPISRSKFYTAFASALILTAVIYPFLFSDSKVRHSTTTQALTTHQAAPQSEALIDRSEDPNLQKAQNSEVAAPVLAKIEPAREIAAVAKTVIAPSAFVRSGPGQEFPKATAVLKGDIVRVIEEKEGWLHIGIKDTIGWIRKDLVGSMQ